MRSRQGRGCQVSLGDLVSLSRLPSERVLVVDGGLEREVPVADLPAYVRAREADAPRWVWDDTARWYPPLLAAGVRVERCHDLRLGHHLLRRAPAVDVRLLEGEQSQHWDRLGPVTPSDPALFSIDDTAEHLRADSKMPGSWPRWRHRPRPSRLGLLLAAESAGALVAAEMTYAGVPAGRRPRAPAHRLARAAAAPRRPAARARGAGGRGARRVRRTRSQPRLAARAAADAAPAGLDVTDTRASSCACSSTPASSRCCVTARAPVPDQRLGLDRRMGERRFRPSYQPAGSPPAGGRPTAGRAVVPRCRSDPHDDGWAFVVADVAQLEPRVLAGMSGDRALARSARGADLYQGMVDDGAVASRQDAKLGLLGAMYGATSGESGRMVAGPHPALPRRLRSVEEAARAGERGQAVRTLLGRGSPSLGGAWDRDPDDPPPDPDSLARHRRAYGRFTRNFIVQGTGAEWALCWIADLRNRLWRLGEAALVSRPHLVFFLHDEVVVHTPAALDAVAAQAAEAAATAAGLLFRDLSIDFPLNISIVRSYADAGKPAPRSSRDRRPVEAAFRCQGDFAVRQVRVSSHADPDRRDPAQAAQVTPPVLGLTTLRSPTCCCRRSWD